MAQTNKTHKKKIAIIGATGFIGSQLCSALIDDFEIIALSRRARESSENILWRQCDLYNF